MTTPTTMTTPGPLAPGTLGRRLLVRVGVVVAAVLVVFASLTAVVLQHTMVASYDRVLDDAFIRQQRYGGADDPVVHLPPGQPSGTIVVEASDLGIHGGVLTDEGVTPLETEAAIALLDNADPRKQTMTVPGYGRYRVVAQPTSQGRFVVGLPMKRHDDVIRDVLLLEAALAVATLGIATWVVRRLVAQSLEPLRQVAATASTVSELDLAHGDVTLPARVPDTGLDPRNEIDQVATSMNRMLGHVEHSLGVRYASEMNVRQFVADASHELRNPLAAIRGYAELTRPSRATLPSDTAHALGRIESEAERMSALVEDLLLLARLDHNPQLTLTVVDTSMVVADATADAQAAGPDHDWEVQLPDAPLFVMADQHRLHQVVANLLANARQHTPPETHVVASVRAVDADVVIDVHDDGPGIAPDTVDRVFERFARGSAGRERVSSAHESTGLGLAIVAAVVAAHGGTTSVDSQPGATTFRITLPRVEAPPSTR